MPWNIINNAWNCFPRECDFLNIDEWGGTDQLFYTRLNMRVKTLLMTWPSAWWWWSCLLPPCLLPGAKLRLLFAFKILKIKCFATRVFIILDLVFYFGKLQAAPFEIDFIHNTVLTTKLHHLNFPWVLLLNCVVIKSIYRDLSKRRSIISDFKSRR